MRLLTVLVLVACAAMFALALSGCKTTSLRSPIAKAAELQSPIVTEPVDPACGKPVYKAPESTVLSHEADGPLECKDGVCKVRPKKVGLLPTEPWPTSDAARPQKFPWWMAAGGLASVLLLIGYLKFKP